MNVWRFYAIRIYEEYRLPMGPKVHIHIPNLSHYQMVLRIDEDVYFDFKD